jgi:hypothetical protein
MLRLEEVELQTSTSTASRQRIQARLCALLCSSGACGIKCHHLVTMYTVPCVRRYYRRHCMPKVSQAVRATGYCSIHRTTTWKPRRLHVPSAIAMRRKTWTMAAENSCFLSTRSRMMDASSWGSGGQVESGWRSHDLKGSNEN